MFFGDDLGREAQALAAIGFMAEAGVDFFHIDQPIARGLANLLLPNDIATANDHANLLCVNRSYAIATRLQ
jgi:hypothetical protein